MTAFVIAAALFSVQAVYLWDFSIDDVGISYRYAKHLAEGQGLVWNPGDPPVEGYSNFLWVLILAAGRWLGFDIEASAKVLGFALGLTNLALILLLSRRLWSGARFWWFPGILVALAPHWIMWTMSGLEIALFGCLLLVSVSALTCQVPRRNRILSVALPGLVLTRPEGFVLALILLIVGFTTARRTASIAPRAAHWAVPLFSVVGVALALTAFRLAYYGSPLPNTVYAKFSLAFPGLPDAGRWFVYGLPFWIGWAFAWRNRSSLSHPLVWPSALALLIAQMGIALPVIPVMSFLHRYQIVFLPLLVLPMPLLFQRLSAHGRTIGLGTVALVVLWPLAGWLPVARRHAAEQYAVSVQQCVVDRLRSLSGKPTVALVDAGRIPYWSDLPTIDIWGLCDREIARRGFSADAILERNPDVFVMSVDVLPSGNLQPRLGMDRAVMSEPRFEERYRLWKYCLGGTETTYWRYDYAIIVNRVWGVANGILPADRPPQ